VNVSSFCSHLMKDIDEIERISSLVSLLMEPSAGYYSTSNEPLVKSRSLLSHFQFKFDCGALGKASFVSHIEPLIGSLRHPYFPCKDQKRTLNDRGYLLLASALHSPYRFTSVKSPSPRVLVFDVGASTYDQGLGGASQEWFFKKLTSRGFLIDSYYAFEVAPLPPQDIFDPVPKSLLPHYHFFNIPASSDPKDDANPLNMIKAISRWEDYVLLKLDIDNSAVEMEFMEQILSDQNLQPLIDELFFEHHVNFQPLNEYWNTSEEGMELADSYELLRRLRNLGIRAHEWN
jgi:hypothetical protein